MDKIEQLERRRRELLRIPRSKEDSEEALLLGKQISIELTKKYSGLIRELADVGIHITSVSDLVNTRARYPEAIGPLLKYLPLVDHPSSKEAFVRALTVREAKGLAVPLLVKEYLAQPRERESLRWAIGNAVNTTITKNDAELIFPIVLNKENGISRHMFVRALGKIKTADVKSVLSRLPRR